MLYVPIGILIWLVPYVDSTKNFMTVGHIWRGNTVYVLLLLVFSGIVQFYMGAPFYQNAYKSLKHANANMDVLVAISTTCAWFYGLIQFFVGYTAMTRSMPQHYRH